jgi:hypothetical protein
MSAYSRLGASLFVPQPAPSIFYLRSYEASGPFLVGSEANARHRAAPLAAEHNREVVVRYNEAYEEWRGACMYLEQAHPRPMEKGAPRYLSEGELWSLHDDVLWRE